MPGARKARHVDVVVVPERIPCAESVDDHITDTTHPAGGGHYVEAHRLQDVEGRSLRRRLRGRRDARPQDIRIAFGQFGSKQKDFGRVISPE
jgi:hypothetical protein